MTNEEDNGPPKYIIPGVTEMDFEIEVVISHNVIMKTTNIMDIRLCSFNCKGFNISEVEHITEIFKSCEILLVQETWLLSSQIGIINKEFSNYNTFGICGMNEETLISGRLYGGCSFFIRKSIASNISYIDLHSHRVCCIKWIVESCIVYIFIFHVILLVMITYKNNSILTKGSTCRKNKKLRFLLIIIEQVMRNLLKKN